MLGKERDADAGTDIERLLLVQDRLLERDDYYGDTLITKHNVDAASDPRLCA